MPSPSTEQSSLAATRAVICKPTFSTPTELPSDLRPAIVFLHGTEDRCVSHGQSLAFHQRLHEHSVDSEIEIYEGTPHAWFNREPDRTTTYERIEAFIHSRFALEPAPRRAA